VWGPDPRALARAARALPWAGAVRSSGRFARVEAPAARSPGEAGTRAALAALPGARIVERVPVDMETTLLALSRAGSGAAP